MSQSLVIQTESDCPRQWQGETFVIDEEVSQIDDSTTEEVLRVLYKSDIDEGYSIPAYRILWTHLAVNDPNRGALLEIIPLSMRLSDHIKSNGINAITIGENLLDLHENMVEDICSEHGCSIQYLKKRVSFGKRLQELHQTIWNTILQPVLLLLDQILSIFISNTKIGDRPIALFPFPGRYGSTLPIAKELDDQTECLIPHIGSSIWRWPDTEYDLPLKSYQNHTSWDLLQREVAVLFESLSSRKRDRFCDELITLIKEEFHIQLPNTIRTSVDLVFDLNIRSLMYYCWADDFFKHNEISAVLVGGPSPRDLAILEAADENNIDSYYVNHSVTMGTEFLPKTDTVQFIPSDAGKRHIERVYDDLDIPPLCVKGRPYFDEQYNQENSDDLVTSHKPSKFTVLAATQPYDNIVRSQFVNHVFQACASSTTVDELKIKTHPSESKSYYRRIIENLDETSQNISLASSDLESELADATLVITINSNVGLESMIQGTPAICYNKWHPSIQHKPYTQVPEIPVIENPENLDKYLKSTDDKSIQKLSEQQYMFAHKQFLDADSSEAIADAIRQRSLGDSP